MQPEALSTRFIATDHGDRFRKTQAVFGLGDFVEHALVVPCGHRALTWLLTMAGGEAEPPGFFTEFKGHKQGRLGCVTICMMGRCGCHKLFLPSDKLSVMKKLTQQRPLYRMSRQA